MQQLALYIIAFFCFTAVAQAQDQVPQGRFHADKVKLGEPIQFSIAFSHDPDLEVLFPDSLEDFAPFELLDKVDFPTVTQNGISYDSAIYTLATYELGEIQELSVPIKVFGDGRKKTKKYIITDTVELIELVKIIPQKPEFFPLLERAFIKKAFNYPPYLIGAIIILLFLAVIAVIFGRMFIRYYRVRKIKKAHISFLLAFDQFTQEGNTENLEKAVLLWKSYVGDIMGIPLASSTTKEISTLLSEEQIIQVLKQLDRSFYAGEDPTSVKEGLTVLREFSHGVFRKAAAKVYFKKKTYEKLGLV